MRKVYGVVLFLALFVATAALAQQSATIRGRVTIAGDGSALPGVTVSIDDLNLSTVTDAQGRYELNVPAGQLHGQSVKVSTSLQGFQPRSANVTLGGGDVSH